jgi:regulatory protein
MAKKKYLSYDEGLLKLQAYCAYQERCHKEVKQKIFDLGIYGEDVDQIIASLIEDNFVNEMRFTEMYVGGKFRVKKWGKYKIIKELKFRYISEYCIKRAIKSEISDEDYYNTLVQLLEKKEPLIREPNKFKRKAKLAKYIIDKGFESPLVWETIKELFP